MFFLSEGGVSVPRGGGCSHERHMPAPSPPSQGWFLFEATNVPALVDFQLLPAPFLPLFSSFPPLFRHLWDPWDSHG